MWKMKTENRHMSKLEKLIAELCTDGVEYKSIREIAEVGTGNSNGNESVDNGLFPFFVRSQTIKSKDDYEYDEEAIIIPGEGGIGEIFHYINGKYALHQRVYRIHFIVEDVNTKFAYYYMQAYFKPFILKKAVSATVTSIRKPMIEDFPFPVPPLPVQREIVRILDNFTELTAELTARKKQYAYYRDKLLTMDNEQVAMCNLEDICESIADGDHMPPPKADNGVPFITISNITEQNKIDFSNTMFVPRTYYDALAEKRKPKRGDILYTVVGSYGIPVCIEEDREFVFQRHIAILRPKKQLVKSRYLFHAMQSSVFKAQADKAAKGAAQKTIGLAALAEMTLPVPSLAAQQRLVEVLDNFDAICTDLSSGLPAEIEARQKQYEYYRDKLLTFTPAD